MYAQLIYYQVNISSPSYPVIKNLPQLKDGLQLRRTKFTDRPNSHVYQTEALSSVMSNIRSMSVAVRFQQPCSLSGVLVMISDKIVVCHNIIVLIIMNGK